MLIQTISAEQTKDEYLNFRAYYNYGAVNEVKVNTDKVQAKWFNLINEWKWTDMIELPDKIFDPAYYATPEFENALTKALEEEIDIDAIEDKVNDLYNSIARKEVTDMDSAFTSMINEMNTLGLEKLSEFMNDDDWVTTK